MIGALSAALGLPLLLLVGLLLLLGLLRGLGIVLEYVPIGADRHETLARARAYADKAIRAVSRIQAPDIRDALIDIAEFCVQRGY